MYKKCYAQGLGRGTNKHLIHLWTDEGYEKIEWDNYSTQVSQYELDTYLNPL